MERILALSNRTASSARALRLMLASMGIEVNGRGTDIYIYIYTHTTANISPLDLPPRELGWSIANNQFGNRRFQSVTSLGRGGGGGEAWKKKRWARYN